MLSAICLILDQSKILSGGNGLTLYTKNFRPVQTESISRQQNKCEWKIKMFWEG